MVAERFQSNERGGCRVRNLRSLASTRSVRELARIFRISKSAVHKLQRREAMESAETDVARFLTESEKRRIVDAWSATKQSLRRQENELGGLGKADPEVFDLCDALNDIDGVCTLQSCAGHRYAHGQENGSLWIRLNDVVASSFYCRAIELASCPGIESVGVGFTEWGGEIATISFLGLNRGDENLNLASATILQFFQSITGGC